MFDVFDDSIDIDNEIESKPLYTLYKGTQRVVDNISRPVVIKKITSKDIKKTRSEIELLADIGKSPFITSVLASGIDKEDFGWVAFEQYGKSVKGITGKKPAELSSLALLISQMLQAFKVLHEREKPIIYNPLQPKNIISNPCGAWLLSSYSLDLDIDREEILDPEYAKYMAPEAFDAETFTPSVQSNLYSLGMIIYEYALGKELFKKQFPAVYNHNTSEYKGNNTLSERWMYWHTSTSITLPTLKELIPTIPEDVSKIVSQMLCKEVKNRAKSAQELFERLVRPDVNMALSINGKKNVKNKPLMTPLTKILLVVLLFVVATGALGVSMMLEQHDKIELTLDNNKITTKNGYVKISGKAKELPKGARIMLEIKQGLITVRDRANYDNMTGKFVCMLELPSLGEYEGLCAVLNSEGSVLFVSVFSITRDTPDKINVTFMLKPAAVGAEISLNKIDKDKKAKTTQEQTIKMESDSTGKAVVELPYGEYKITITHPRYREYTQTFSTGFKANNIRVIQLTPLSDEDVLREKLKLQKEYEALQNSLDPNNPDPETLKKMAEIQKKLSQLIQPNATNPLESNYERSLGEKRKYLENKLKDLKAKMDSGDPKAKEEYAKTLKELQDVNDDSVAANLRDMQHERSQLLRRAQSGDYSAVKKLKALDESLRDQGLDPDNIVAGLSNTGADSKEAGSTAPYTTDDLKRIQKEREELLKRAKNGDPEAIKALNKLDGELIDRGIDPNNILAGVTSKDSDKEKPYTTAELLHLNKERQELLKRAESGDPEAIKALKALDEKLRAHGIDPENIQAAIAESLKTEKGRNQFMSDEQGLTELKFYVESILPSKAFTVRSDGVIGKIVVTGYVYDMNELAVILVRLEPIQDKVEIDIAVDPNKLTENLSKALEVLDIKELRVHPFLIGPQYRLYIGVAAKTSAPMMDKILKIALDYVSSSDAVAIDKFPEGALNEE